MRSPKSSPHNQPTSSKTKAPLYLSLNQPHCDAKHSQPKLKHHDQAPPSIIHHQLRQRTSPSPITLYHHNLAKMSMRIVPDSSNKSTFSHNQTASAPSAPGVHDTLRHGVGPSTTADSATPASAHPLEARLKNWEATQESLRMESLKRTFGMAEPIRRGMELKIVRDGEWRPMALGGNGVRSVHEDILQGKDDMMTWEDVYTGEETRSNVAFHDEMERKVKMQ